MTQVPKQHDVIKTVTEATAHANKAFSKSSLAGNNLYFIFYLK